MACFAWLCLAASAAAAPGDVDPLDLSILTYGGDSFINATVVQPDGKTIIAGRFDGVLGVEDQNIARINADGTRDGDFIQFRFTGVAGTVNSVALQADGKILLGGDFTYVLVSGRNNIARLNANGRLDTGFNPDANGDVHSVVVQADGKILLGGEFSTVGGTPRQGLARLNADGTLDAGFNPDVDAYVHSMVVQADGKILLGGLFNTVGGTTRHSIARVDAAGALDTGFNPSASGTVTSVAVQADGRILLGGNLTSVGGSPRAYIARVNANGTLDAGFNPDLNSYVHSVVVQTDGRILLGGEFTTVGGTPRNSFARLLNDPATQTLSTPDATQVTWTRGGSSPEVSLVTFEQSTDSGASWTPLGSGTRIGSTPNWQLTGLALTGSGQLRARGRTSGGYQNGSSGLVEQVTSFAFAPEIAVSGNSVDIADGDATPDPADHTDVGDVNIVNATLVRTFTIANHGNVDLTLGTVTVSGTHAADFTVSLQPASPVAPNGSTSFQVSFDPRALGLREATLSIGNNDPDENPFDFSIQGTGTGTAIVPDAPLILSAMPLDQAARISFNAPGSDGGSAILDYSASCTPGPISTTLNAVIIDVGGLTNNVAYRCSVRARNAVGMGAPSGELSVIPGSSGSSADLSITKTNGVTFVNGGAVVEYTITVTNPGPAAVIGARVEDAIGAGTDFSAAVWTCTPLNNAACPSPANGSGSLDAMVDLPATSSVQFVFGALPNAGSETPISNIASVTPPAAISDANLNNNVALDGPDVRGIFRNGFE
jgi:uncharacterized delta-60 repeat protein/uncharacterized repeat protein (TIGR01451 family)